MAQEPTSFRLSAETLTRLRKIAAWLETSQAATIERLVLDYYRKHKAVIERELPADQA